jgi:ureidoacrylate peracid hydrolase
VSLVEDDVLLARRLSPPTTAVIVVDFQNDFCADGGWYDSVGHPLAMGQEAAGRAAELLPVLRRHGMMVVFTQTIGDPEFLSPTAREGYERKGMSLENYCRTGSWGADFYGVAPEEGEHIVRKHRYSGFVGTELDLLLRSNGIENVVLMGVATNVCVESTARDASMRDYRTTVVADCCGTYDQQLHDSTMENVRRAFGVVTSSAEVVRVLDGSSGSAERP